MNNLLQGELYKLFRSKCIYICGVMILACALSIYGVFSLIDAMKQGDIENGSYGVTVSVEGDGQEQSSVWDEMDISTILGLMFASVGSILISIYASIFVFGEYANGAIKNVVGKGYSRRSVFGAKYISTAVGTVILEILMLLAVLMCEIFILRANRINADVVWNLCGYMVMNCLFGASLTGIIVMISQICRNLGVGIAVSIFMIMFSSFFTSVINVILKYFRIEINVCDYWILDLISSCPSDDMDSRFLIRAIACAMVWFVLAFCIGSIHFRKVDVK